jgi:transposase-like protein
MTGHAVGRHGHRFPPEIISHAVWFYRRFCFSFLAAEDLLTEPWLPESAVTPVARGEL